MGRGGEWKGGQVTRVKVEKSLAGPTQRKQTLSVWAEINSINYV